MIKAILLSCILALGALLFFQWRHWPPAPPAEGKEAGSVDLGLSSAEGEQNPLDRFSPPLHEADYASVVERPLFRPDRRPPEKEPEPEPEPVTETGPAVDLDTMDLTAVLITPGSAIAWVRTQANPIAKRFRVGEEIEGWKIKAIHPNEVELTRGGKTDWLILRNYAQPFQPKSPSRRGRNRGAIKAAPKPLQRRPRPPVRKRPERQKPQKNPPRNRNHAPGKHPTPFPAIHPKP